MTKAHTLTDAEVWTLANALRAAASQYLTDAEQLDAAKDPRSATGFRDQAQIANAWAVRIESADSLSIAE